MKRLLFPIFIISILFIAIWSSLSFGTGRGYIEYTSGWEYRRLHPELIPSPIVVKAFAMGHTNSYASFEWLQLIQYIGDNVYGNRFLRFTHTILENITILHPYFPRPYEIDLILTPLSRGENLDPATTAFNEKYTKNAIILGKKGIETLCDMSKIEKIKIQNISETLWNDHSLRNPCVSGMLPYYIAYATYQMGDNKAEASEYYKITAMNDDGPTASRVLSIIALSAEGDFISSAMTFLLIGSAGYDIEPYSCRQYSKEIIRDITKKRPLDATWINELQKKEPLLLKDTRDPNHPASNMSDNCYDMTTRGIRELYLSYIANIAKNTTAKDKNDLISQGLLKTIPTLSTQSGFTVREINGIWSYRQN